MKLQSVWNHRRPLERMRRRIREGEVTLGFIGGSITDARPRHNWPEPVISWLVETCPDTRFVVENAAIGATGSDLAVMRAQRDLIDRGCDIVFIDYAVNDNGVSAERRGRTREGLIRKLLDGGGRDLVLVHTFSQDMYASMAEGGVPDTVRHLEELAEHYGIGSVWMGLYALGEVKAGRMRWEEWLPDGLHPTSRGSLSYGQSVIAYLREELQRAESAGEWDAKLANALTHPLYPDHWGASGLVPLESVRTQGPWVLRRWPYYEWLERVWETAAPGARMSIDFIGRGIALGFDFGKTSSEFRYRIDGGEWRTSERDRPDWAGDDGWLRLYVIGDDLPDGPHTCELEVVHGNGPGCTGTNFRLGLIGAIR